MKLPDALQNAYDKRRLAHAYLFYGLPAGKYQDPVLYFFQLLACDSEQSPCGDCRECKQIEEKVHPDLLALNEQNEKITVKKVREKIIRRADLTPARGKRLYFWLNDISRLTDGASNALLKVLEEPPGETVFVLTARSRWQCLATIRSRCQWIRFPLFKQRPQSPEEALGNFWDEAAPDRQEMQRWQQLLTGETTSDKISWSRKKARKFLSFLLSCVHQGYTGSELGDGYEKIIEERNLTYRLLPDILERLSELEQGGQPLLVVNSILEEIYYPEENQQWLNVI